MPLFKRDSDVVEAFAASAMSWGWEQDQGSGPSVNRSEKAFKADKAALLRHISRLRNDLRRARTLAQNWRAAACENLGAQDSPFGEPNDEP